MCRLQAENGFAGDDGHAQISGNGKRRFRLPRTGKSEILERTTTMKIMTVSAFVMVALAVSLSFSLTTPAAPHTSAAQDFSLGSPTRLPGLQAAARIIRDTDGIAHIRAHNEHDLFFLQGYVHAQDRLFQMDVSRREASGTLAEILGPAALPEDVQLRTIGLRRAAVRSLAVSSSRLLAALQAYADGVNAFAGSHPLPPEYGALELTQFEPWTPTDSLAVTKLIAFGLSFNLDIAPTIALLSYQKAGSLLGFDGTKLFFEDLDRSAPFDPASTIPDASVPRASWPERRGSAKYAGPASSVEASASAYLNPRAVDLGREWSEKVKVMPVFRRLSDEKRSGGSNEWAIGKEVSASGVPLLANDPHLALTTPSTFYPIHLTNGDFDVIGSGFAGIPSVIIGHNRFISWGATVDPIDVTDTFQEKIVPDPASPSGLSTVFKGNLEPIIPIPEVFRQNNIGDHIPDNITIVPPGNGIPPATLIVPRRNNGPIIMLDLANGVGLSVQYTGFSGTREIETFLMWDGARNLDDFLRGVSFFDVGSLNFAYSDISGNTAYLTGGALPIREDLQAGAIKGLPPVFIRNGTGGNEWLPMIHRQPNQVIPFEILPFAETPHIFNPPAGFFVNSNNDPIGITLNNNPFGRLRPDGGIYYLSYTYSGGFRNGRITQRIRQLLSTGSGKVSFEDMQDIQADVTLLDAQVFVPYITQAFADAQFSNANPLLASFAAGPGVAAAVSRLSRWDFTTPTGITEGYDASDIAGHGLPPSQTLIDASVAATIYSAWRSRFIANTIDAVLAPAGLPQPLDTEALKALRNLLDNFSSNNGVGASGVNFFNVPGVSSAADRRDILILKSVADALALLASPAFADAFHNSTNQDDYRWGRLHRIVFSHVLGSPFSIPPAGGAFPQPLPNLPGLPTDGGFETVDAATHDVRAASENGFIFANGPNDRFVSSAHHDGMRAVTALPGGTSGVLGSPFYFNLLPGWLVNDAFPLLFTPDAVDEQTLSVTTFVP
jgi:penicillin amidase